MPHMVMIKARYTPGFEIYIISKSTSVSARLCSLFQSLLWPASLISLVFSPQNQKKGYSSLVNKTVSLVHDSQRVWSRGAGTSAVYHRSKQLLPALQAHAYLLLSAIKIEILLLQYDHKKNQYGLSHRYSFFFIQDATGWLRSQKHGQIESLQSINSCTPRHHNKAQCCKGHKAVALFFSKTCSKCGAKKQWAGLIYNGNFSKLFFNYFFFFAIFFIQLHPVSSTLLQHVCLDKCFPDSLQKQVLILKVHRREHFSKSNSSG